MTRRMVLFIVTKKELEIVPVTVPEYSLLREPWLQVIMESGDIRGMGLLELFENLNGIRSLMIDIDTEDPALFRMLLAIVYRALDPVMTDEWESWWNAGRIPVGPIIDYLNEHEDEFYLFHPSKPFLQSMVDPKKVADLKGLDCLMAEPVGIDVLSNRTERGVSTMGMDEIARRLVSVLQYDRAAGHTSYIGALDESSHGITYATEPYLGKFSVVRLKTGSLMKDVMFSLIPLDSGLYLFDEPDEYDEYDGDDGITAGIPFWETGGLRNDDTDARKLKTKPTSIEEALVYPSRRIRLFRMSDGSIKVLLCPGKHPDLTGCQNLEPMAAYYEREEKDKSVIMAPWHASDKLAFWRSLTSLLADKGRTPPMTLRWAAMLQDKGILASSYIGNITVTTVQYGSMSSIITSVDTDNVSLPVSIIESPMDIQKIDDAIGMSKSVIKAYSIFMESVSIAAGMSKDIAYASASSKSGIVYELLGDDFLAWVGDMQCRDAGDHALSDWMDTMEDTIMSLVISRMRSIPKRAILGRAIEGRVYSAPMAESKFIAAIKKIRSNSGN